jgi:hypothetical protein
MNDSEDLYAALSYTIHDAIIGYDEFAHLEVRGFKYEPAAFAKARLHGNGIFRGISG